MELSVSSNATVHALVSYAATCLSTGTNKYCNRQRFQINLQRTPYELQINGVHSQDVMSLMS